MSSPRTAAAAWAAVVVLLAACGPVEPARPGPDSTPSEPTSARGTVPVKVPDVLGLLELDALERLRGVSLESELMRVDSCDPAGTVIGQSPPADLVISPDDIVAVTLARAPRRPCDALALAAGRALVRFARGHPEPPPLAERIDFFLGDEPANGLTEHEARTPGAWVIACDGYAERSCPISVLDPLTGADQGRTGAVVGFDPGPPRGIPRGPRRGGSCPERSGRLPRVMTDNPRTVTLIGRKAQSCIQVWALQIWVDEHGRIEAANLSLGSP